MERLKVQGRENTTSEERRGWGEAEEAVGGQGAHTGRESMGVERRGWLAEGGVPVRLVLLPHVKSGVSV